MVQDKLIFRMAARCEAAGRPNNEDNYQLDSDLADNQWGFTADEKVELGEKGALLLVCDGMGGMNAGEVASDIAVRTIKELFAAENLSKTVLASPMAYVKNAIVAADAAIKNYGKEHPETEGMGSTCVVAWLLGKKLYVGWCGDSRCYCYNPKSGLVRLSHDHSYVQELVDAGKLTEELAFDHPNSNIITRSLGDPSGEARPDVKMYDLHNEDIILLCSDGLCGCLRDNEIEEQIAAHQNSMQECRDALWEADKAAGWHDNVTIGIAQVLSGGSLITDDKNYSDFVHCSGVGLAGSNIDIEKGNSDNKKPLFLLLFIILLVVVAGVGGYFAYPFVQGSSDKDIDIVEPVVDTTETMESISDSVKSSIAAVEIPTILDKESKKMTSEEKRRGSEDVKLKESMKNLKQLDIIPQVVTVLSDEKAQEKVDSIPIKKDSIIFSYDSKKTEVRENSIQEKNPELQVQPGEELLRPSLEIEQNDNLDPKK